MKTSPSAGAAAQETDIETAEVLVCGGGLAGYCAALGALESGKRVLLVEKMDETGGSTVISGGAVAFAGTDEQRAAGIEDSADLLLSDLKEVGGHLNDVDLLNAYVAAQLDTYQWLKRQGVQFTSVQLGGGQSVPRSNRVDTRQVMAALSARAQASDRFELRRATAAQRLRRNDAGLLEVDLLSRDGQQRVLRVSGGVVLATGGFSRSEEWLTVFAPVQRTALRIGGRGNTGDGLRMGMALGANLRDMGQIKGTFGVHPTAGVEERLLIHPMYKGAIAVNAHGHRFVDESVSYKVSGDACLAQPGGVSWQIFDQDIMDLSVDGVTTSDFRAALASGHLHQAADIATLGQAIGVDADAIAATLARYNADVGQGRDAQFGRTGLANGYGGLRKIARAPFYAYPSTSAVLATYAGLQVDAQTRVRDVYGAPIDRLFAAGEVVGGFHGAAYMTGSSLGKSAVFGRIAGQQAAACA